MCASKITHTVVGLTNQEIVKLSLENVYAVHICCVQNDVNLNLGKKFFFAEYYPNGKGKYTESNKKSGWFDAQALLARIEYPLSVEQQFEAVLLNTEYAKDGPVTKKKPRTTKRAKTKVWPILLFPSLPLPRLYI